MCSYHFLGEEEGGCWSSPPPLPSVSNSAYIQCIYMNMCVNTHTHAMIQGPYLIDVLESRNYTSSESENTGSPDSITSDHISFLATSSTTSLKNSTHPASGGGAKTHHSKVKSGATVTKGNHFSPGPASPEQQAKSGTPARKSDRTSSPRNIPSAAGSRGGQKSQQFSSGSVSPVKSGRSRSPKQQQRQKQQNGGGGNLSSSVGAPVPRARGGGMRHAVSFDQGFVGGSPLRSYTAPQASDNSQNQSSPAFELLAAQLGGQQLLHRQLQEQPMDKTARRLFSPDTSTSVTTTASHVITPKALFSISESVPTSLFSQGTSADSTTTLNSLASVDQGDGVSSSGGGGGGVLPLKVISLEQVEKQMVEDVPSPPVSVNPLTIFSSTALPASTHFPTASTGKSLASSQEGASFEPNQHVLLQPSAFVASSGSSPSVTSAHRIVLLQGSNTALNQQGLPQSFSTGGVRSPAPPVTSVAISIEPPSPVVDLNTGFTTSSGGGSSLPHHVQEQFFPAIPPLVHSPGMRAAPVSTVPPTQPVQSRREPSSLTTTTASATAQPSSTTRQSRAQQSVTQTVTPKGAGKLSQHVSSTVEEMPQLPSTPSRYFSQSTPSVS